MLARLGVVTAALAIAPAAWATPPAATTARPTVPAGMPKEAKSIGRDWAAKPAIVEVVPKSRDVYAMSDMHGHYQHTVRLLQGNGLIAAAPDKPGEVKWTGGKATLVVVGDMIDKDRRSVQTLDLIRALQASARASGGDVVVTMGNHEAEFLADPENKYAERQGHWEGMSTELKAMHVSPKAVAAGTDAEGRGEWLRSLPLGAKLGDYFFTHSGDTGHKTIAQLEKAIEKSLDKRGFEGKAAIGAHSVLDARAWYGHSLEDPIGKANAGKLGVKHIVFGHQPSGLSEMPKTIDVRHIVATQDETLVKIDTGMADGYRGRMIHIDMKKDEMEALGRKGGSDKVY